MENRFSHIRFRGHRKSCLTEQTFFRQSVTIPTLPADLCLWDRVLHRHAAFWGSCRAGTAEAARGSRVGGESTSHPARSQRPALARGRSPWTFPVWLLSPPAIFSAVVTFQSIAEEKNVAWVQESAATFAAKLAEKIRTFYLKKKNPDTEEDRQVFSNFYSQSCNTIS